MKIINKVIGLILLCILSIFIGNCLFDIFGYWAKLITILITTPLVFMFIRND